MFISMVYWWAIKKFTILFRKGFKVAQITKFLMFGGYIEFTFLIQYWCRFSYELIVYREFPVVCRRISYGFVKGSRKDLNFEILHIWKVYRMFIFHPIFNSYNCKIRQSIVSIILLCQAKYCVHTWFLYTLVQLSFVNMLQ